MTQELYTQNKLNVIYFNSDHTLTPECSGKLAEFMDLSWTLVSTWSEMAESIQRTDNALLSIHVDMMTRGPVESVIEFMEALDTIIKFNSCLGKLRVAVVITPTTPRSVIRDLQKTQCQGVLLKIGDYSDHEVNQALKALGSGIPYWPKHILDNLPGGKKKPANTDSVTLTTRQEQVFKHVTERGSSNKAIARSLGITESTVKLHLTEIFKKYAVKSRTQLAVFSHKT